MINFILGLILLVVLVPVIRYLVKEKKKGNTCIGCPNASKCGKHNCQGLHNVTLTDEKEKAYRTGLNIGSEQDK